MGARKGIDHSLFIAAVQAATPLNLKQADTVPKVGMSMLHYATVFFVIALIAALFGFGGIAVSAVGIGKALFVIFSILAVASFLFGILKRA